MSLTNRERRQRQKELHKQNMKRPTKLEMLSQDEWLHLTAPMRTKPYEMWRSRTHLVQVFNASQGWIRISVIRTEIGDDKHPKHDRDNFIDGITWDDLMRIKREVGRGSFDAVECFPADMDIVNLAAMRHLWILPRGTDLACFWRRGSDIG